MQGNKERATSSIKNSIEVADSVLRDRTKPCKVVGEMCSLGGVVEQWGEKLVDGVLNNFGGRNDRHRGNSFSERKLFFFFSQHS